MTTTSSLPAIAAPALVLAVQVPRAAWMTANRPTSDHRFRARLVRDIQALTRRKLEALRVTSLDGLEAGATYRARWTVHYPYGTGWKHGDAANAAPTTKAILDAVVKHGALTGDGPRVILSETFTRGTNLRDSSTPGAHDVVLELERADR